MSRAHYPTSARAVAHFRVSDRRAVALSESSVRLLKGTLEMNVKTLLLAGMTTVTFAAPTVAQADQDDWR